MATARTAPLPPLRTGHTHYMGLSGSALRTAIGLVSGLCFVAFGYGQGDIGGLLDMTAFRHAFPDIDMMGSPTLAVFNRGGGVVAAWNLGCFVGAMLTIFLADRFGRRRSILLGLLIMIVGKLLQVSAFGLAQLVIGRFLAGFGNGFIASTAPAWQAECLKTHRRGTLLLVSFGSCVTLGLAIAYWIDYGFSFVPVTSASWRPPIAMGLIFMILPLLIIIWMPESPRYLVLTGREQEAKNVLSALTELSPDDEDVHREFMMVKNTVLYMASGGLKEAFTMGKYRYVHRTILAVCLQVMQQFTGINLFMQYLGFMVSTQIQLDPKLSLLIASCGATEFFLASLVAVVGIDRFWGRRTLTMFGAAGMCVCLIILCVLSWADTQKTRYAMAAFFFVYCTFFSIGWQGMSWLWSVELIPLCARGPANALATAANWLANFVVVMTAPAMFMNTKYRTYITYAVTNFLIIPAIYFFYPETGYRSLEEVDLFFAEASSSKYPWLAVVPAARSEPHRDHLGEGEARSDDYSSGSGAYDSSEKESADKPKPASSRVSLATTRFDMHTRNSSMWSGHGGEV